ncbi:unnamed protein product [Tuber melanosporum]|uniref:(Perigord truffle) hypothetical protein n=1 Tax=Tuber melanosporum (strain Mel28) TaxID=656061 RepID=D5GLJ4_TUBMM|nr:uncharacterized protein GSTUM_00010235001 [Tuber melanosporum]CAZ85387.1 unnamed protein product [Tuber melanosporum]
MAPVTRARRRRDSIPLVPVLDDPNSPHPAAELPLLQRLEGSTAPASTPSKLKKQKPIAEGTGEHTSDIVNQPPPPPLSPGNEPTNSTAADSESDSDSDDEAPEVVSLDTGREVVEKAQDEAKRAAEAQADAARKKRKAHGAKLKEQKEEANERKKKRRKVNPEDEEEEVDNSRALAITEKSTEPPVDGANVANPSPLSPPPAEQHLTKSNSPALLPETLLAQVAATKRRHHQEEQPDIYPNPEPGQKNQVTNTGTGGRNAERNRRKKQRQKLNRTLKKGPVSVKVLKDDMKSRKILPPPAAKTVGSIKDSWLFGRKAGGAMRRDVVTGFVRK